MKEDSAMSKYLTGKLLYGDDFDIGEIEEWFEGEREGYAELGARDWESYRYPYHKINTLHGYRYLNATNVDQDVLSIGGAYGEELLPILDRIGTIRILEPSLQLRQEELKGVPLTYIDPTIGGDIILPDDSIDIVTCFGVLHHIPNVSHVVSEISRVLRSGGVFITREPIVSMGDWSKPRHGLTKHERGIPYQIFRNILLDQGFEILHESFCLTPPFERLFKLLSGRSKFDSMSYLKVDAIISRLALSNYRYHAKGNLERIRPTAVYYYAVKT